MRVSSHSMILPRRRRIAQHAGADLIALHGFEERFEIAFAKAFVALALNDLEKDRSDQRGGENLQQKTAASLRPVRENAQRPHAIHRLAVAGETFVQFLV